MVVSDFLRNEYKGSLDVMLLEEDMNFNARAASFSVRLSSSEDSSSLSESPPQHTQHLHFSVLLSMRIPAGSEGKRIPAGFNRHSEQRV